MVFPKKTLLASALLFGAASVFADTADLRVIGSIAPTACAPAFADAGAVDYGNIPSAGLSATASTPLGPRTLSYTIVCNAPIAVGTSWLDGRATSAGGGSIAFGLGQQGNAAIGNYSVRHLRAGATGDGAVVDMIVSDDSGSTWAALGPTGEQRNDNSRIQSYATPGLLAPTAFTTFAGTVEVNASIAPTNTLDMTRSITLDGLSTMTVRYL